MKALNQPAGTEAYRIQQGATCKDDNALELRCKGVPCVPLIVVGGGCTLANRHSKRQDLFVHGHIALESMLTLVNHVVLDCSSGVISETLSQKFVPEILLPKLSFYCQKNSFPKAGDNYIVYCQQITKYQSYSRENSTQILIFVSLIYLEDVSSLSFISIS